jgi:hypothetical protein
MVVEAGNGDEKTTTQERQYFCPLNGGGRDESLPQGKKLKTVR